MEKSPDGGDRVNMIAIVMRRQSGPVKRLPEWEEAAAVAAPVQNMHIQSTKFPQLACYWSSWHDAARESRDMKDFLNMETDDKCLGFFVVAQQSLDDPTKRKDRRMRSRSLMEVEWRTTAASVEKNGTIQEEKKEEC